jgi:hypothetical protein
MTHPALTAASRKGILWLPADGSWCVGSSPDRSTTAGLQWLVFRKLVEEEYGDFGARGGRCIRRRLTPAGITARREVEGG